MTLKVYAVLAAFALAVLIAAPFLLDEPVYDAQEPDDDDGVLVVMGDYTSLNTPGLYQATLTPEQTNMKRLTVSVMPREPSGYVYPCGHTLKIADKYRIVTHEDGTITRERIPQRFTVSNDQRFCTGCGQLVDASDAPR